VIARESPTRATLANARDVVAREWARATTARMKDDFYRTLATRYRVRIESGGPVTEVATAGSLGR
jgi:hypothetical protein